MIYFYENEKSLALGLSEDVLERAPGSPAAHFASLVRLAVLTQQGRTRSALAHAAELERGAYGGPPDSRVLVTGFRLIALRADGQATEALRSAESWRAEAMKQHWRDAVAFADMVAGGVLHGIGRPRGGCERLREAILLLRERDFVHLAPWALAYLAMTQVHTGDVGGARSSLAEANSALAESAGVSASDYLAAEVRLAEAFVEAWDQPRRGAEKARNAARWSLDRGVPLGAGDGLHLLTRLGNPEGAMPGLEELAASTEQELATLRLEHAVALQGQDGALLDRTRRRFEELGWTTIAMEIAASARNAYTETDPSCAAEAQRDHDRLLAFSDNIHPPWCPCRRPGGPADGYLR